MKCKEVREILSAYADGEINGQLASKLRMHLSECSSCKAEYEAMDVMQTKLIQMMNESVETPDMSDMVMNLLPVQRRQSTGRWVFAMVTALLLTVISTIWMLSPKGIEHNVKNSEKKLHQPYLSKKATKPMQQNNIDKQVAKANVAPSNAVHNRPIYKSRRYYVYRLKHKHLPVKQAPVQQSEQKKSVNVVAAGVDSDKQVEITMTLSIEDIKFLQMKKKEINLPPNEQAVNVERPPLEVVRSNPSNMVGQDGG